jgi:hypothetical protein
MLTVFIRAAPKSTSRADMRKGAGEFDHRRSFVAGDINRQAWWSRGIKKPLADDRQPAVK